MSLLDSIARLLGGSGADGTRDEEPGSTRGEVSEPTRGEGLPWVADRDLQSHGSHWDALVPPDGREAAVRDLLAETVSEGTVIAGTDRRGTEVTGYRHRDGPLGTLAVTLDGRVATAYPVGEGVANDLHVDRLQDWESGVEAWLGGSLGEAALALFPTNYFARPREALGGDCTATIALLAYDLRRADRETVVDDDGRERDVSGTVEFGPSTGGAPDDFVIRTTASSVEPVSHAGFDAYRIRAPLVRREDGPDAEVDVYVAAHNVAGEVPSPGDDVAGAAWMQARVE